MTTDTQQILPRSVQVGEANPREENNSQTAKQFPNELVSEIAPVPI